MAVITGTSGADTLNGTASADEISGLGDSDRLIGAGGDDTLLGGNGNDSLAGGSGADSLVGGAGVDTLNGGNGSDTYVIDASDFLIDSGGIDTVRANFSYTAGFENLVLVGSAAIDGTGNTAANVITGNNAANRLSGLGGDDTLGGAGGNDRLLGGNGNDSLVGGAGVDTLNGGGGNDTYIIDASDTLIDTGGIDTVRANFSHTLVSGFENLILTGSAAINGTGNGAANTITGNNAANLLSGGGGADVLQGGGGNDVLMHGVGDASVQGGSGTDTLRVQGSGVTLDLTAIPNTVHSDIEVIDLTGTGVNSLGVAASDVLALSTTANVVRVAGNAGDRVLALDGNWTFVQNVVIGADTYARYTNGAAVLQVDVDIDRDAIAQASINLSGLDGTNGFRLAGVAAGDRSGYSLSDAGDVNGDGFDDLIVGAHYAGPNGAYSGASYVVFGKASGFASSINLATLNGTNGFRLAGVDADDRSGYSVSAAGDVNGDGFGDLIVGAYGVDSYSGVSYVVFGKASGFASSINPSTLNGTNGFRLAGAAANDFFGYSVSDAGDVNGDGFDDLIVGASNADPNGNDASGASYVVFGKASGFASSIDLSSLNGTSGFRLAGAVMEDHSGGSVSAAGDVNGDGFDDLLVGAPDADPNGSKSGASYVVFGKASGFASSFDLSTLDGTNGFRLAGVAMEDFSGDSVSDAGDVNGDGFDDLIVGAFGADPYSAGASYVVFGKASGFASSIDLSSLDGTNGFRLAGVAQDRSGRSVSAAGDVNGDGFDDLIVGAVTADPNGSDSGASYVVFGKASGFASSIDLSSLDGTNGFRLAGVAASDLSGRSVSAAGDVNGDGFDDLMVGANSADPNGSDSGTSYVVFGGDFTDAVTYLGTSGADVMAGSSAAETFVAGRGGDTITGGGGADVIRAAAGNDQILVANTNFADIDGGSGTDTLKILGSGRTLNLVARPNNEISDIERIDLTGSGDNTLRLSHRDLFDLSDTSNQLRVDGNAGDTVDLAGAWTDEGAGATYHPYTLGAATILIDNDIFVT